MSSNLNCEFTGANALSHNTDTQKHVPGLVCIMVNGTSLPYLRWRVWCVISNHLDPCKVLIQLGKLNGVQEEVVFAWPENTGSAQERQMLAHECSCQKGPLLCSPWVCIWALWVLLWSADSYSVSDLSIFSWSDWSLVTAVVPWMLSVQDSASCRNTRV